MFEALKGLCLRSQLCFNFPCAWMLFVFLLTFRWNLYQQKSRALKDLPPSSSCIKSHILRSHYAIRLYANLLRSIELDPLSFGWIKKDSVLFPNKSLRYFPEWMYVSCKCKSCLRRCSCRSSDLPCTEYCKCGEACLNNEENEF